ncbi:MAG: MerR family DNA-binding protein [Acidobacteria bacterium]|nr:MerR family DNA-binding protein [Acidobacteriota bacterium]
MHMTIGSVAEQAGVGVETVRYYQRRGLIPVPPKAAAGFRHYPDETVARIRFIKRAQELGFSLVEIDELLSLRVSPEASCADVQRRALSKIAELDRKIATVAAMREALVSLVTTCEEGTASATECPILEALDEDLASTSRESEQ